METDLFSHYIISSNRQFKTCACENCNALMPENSSILILRDIYQYMIHEKKDNEDNKSKEKLSDVANKIYKFISQ